MNERINIKTNISRSLSEVWACWTAPEHIIHWNAASDDWCCPHAVNDLRVGGRFSYRMEARDGSFGFDFCGTYTEVQQEKLIAFTLDDDRTVTVRFTPTENGTQVEETFEAEMENPVEMQKTGWQMILDRFRDHVETSGHTQ